MCDRGADCCRQASRRTAAAVKTYLNTVTRDSFSHFWYFSHLCVTKHLPDVHQALAPLRAHAPPPTAKADCSEFPSQTRRSKKLPTNPGHTRSAPVLRLSNGGGCSRNQTANPSHQGRARSIRCRRRKMQLCGIAVSKLQGPDWATGRRRWRRRRRWRPRSEGSACMHHAGNSSTQQISGGLTLASVHSNARVR